MQSFSLLRLKLLDFCGGKYSNWIFIEFLNVSTFHDLVHILMFTVSFK